MGRCSVRHIGLKIDFHHPESDRLRLSDGVEDQYGADKEKAAIFTESASNRAFSSEDMLEWYLARSATAHLTAAGGGEEGSRRMAMTFPLQFPEKTFHMMTDRGAVDIKALRLAVEVTVEE